MKFFIDTADVKEIEKYASWGVVDGVTTNPSLMSKQSLSFKEAVGKICELVDGPISVEVTAMDTKGMVKEAEEYAAMHKNIVIKVPCNAEGLKVMKILKEKGIRTNATLVFSANQGLLCAKAGASYISPFIGRLDDIGEDGMLLIEELVEILKNYGFKTEIIVASVRHPRHVTDAAVLGAHIATIPPEILEKMVSHPKTDEGIKKFLEDWEKVSK